MIVIAACSGYPSRVGQQGESSFKCPFAEQSHGGGDDFLKSNINKVVTKPLKQQDEVLWTWQGALQSSSMVIKARMSDGILNGDTIGAWIHHPTETNHLDSMKWFPATSLEKYGIATIYVTGLTPKMQYVYVVSSDEKKHPYEWKSNLRGRFRTPALEGTPMSFSFAFASCADNHSNSVIFDVIREHAPLIFIHTGDLHYGNIEDPDPKTFHNMYDQVMSNSRQSEFFRNLPIAYMWDDHDFGPNNADSTSIGRAASIEAYLAGVPHYPLAAYHGQLDPKWLPSIYFTFKLGNVKFILTDTSSSKVVGETILGASQLEWLLDELVTGARDSSLIVWINTVPWITPGDKWGAFEEEQRKISQCIQKNNIQSKLIMLCGDAHMLAVDDGSHSMGGFPVFQAASLDAKPTSKGGPYSHGIYPGRGQYGWIDIVDNGSIACAVFKGRRVDSNGQETELVRFDTCDSSNSSPPRLYVPSPPWIQALWKSGKKWISESLPFGDEVMVYFDGFSISFIMACEQFWYVPVVLFCFAISLIGNKRKAKEE